jgi:phosphoribosylformylglycinamidine (FGAM) synthase-like amidotransferase family enzyme
MGKIIESANPTGATRNIAGIRNKQNNVFGIAEVILIFL